MVFMAVGEQDSPNTVLILAEVSDVRNDDVNTQQFGIRKHDTAVDYH
jgi:hypothetical protein